MNKYSIQTTILIYMSISAFILVLALGLFVLLNHTKSLENDLINKMHIMSDDILEHGLYTLSEDDLKDFFRSNKSYHKDSYGTYITEIEFHYMLSNNRGTNVLSIIKELPDGRFLVISSTSKYIDEQVKELLVRLVSGLILTLGLIMLGLYILLKKLLRPLNSLVNYCNDTSSPSHLLKECRGSYEVNALKEAVVTLQNRNQTLCQEKQNIFKEAAHEIKTPIAILKARLSLFDKSDMKKDEFIKESRGDISTISNKLRELIFLKAIEWDIKQAKESVQMQNQCSMMQQLFKPILEKKELKMTSNLQEDFAIYIHKEAIGRVMQAIFENIFMHTENGTTIETFVDAKKNQLSIVNKSGEESDEILFSSHIGSKLIERLADKLDYEYSAYEKDGYFYTTIIFKGQNPFT